MTKSLSAKRENRIGWLSILPVIILEVGVCAYPIVQAFLKSFTNWDGMFKSDFLGLENYTKLFAGEDFWLLIRNSAVLLLSIPIQAFVGLAIAVVLYEGVRGWKFYRMVYYLPSIISAVTVGYLFKILFGFNGPINLALRSVGLEGMAIEWLGNSMTALLVVLFCLVWSNIGWQILVIFGGLAGIDSSIFEAAEMDGATWWQRFFKIILPMLVRTLEYSFITSMLWIFSGVFPLIYSITNGGPGYSTTTIDYMVYLKAFRSSRYGEGCALAMILLAIIFLITKLQMHATNKMDDWG